MEPELFREGSFSQIEFGMWKYNRTGHWQFVQNNRIWDYSTKRAFQRTFQWRNLLIVKLYLICGNRTIAKQFVQNYSHHCLLQWDLGLFKPKSLAKSLFCCKISQNNEEDRFVFFLETMFKDGSLHPQIICPAHIYEEGKAMDHTATPFQQHHFPWKCTSMNDAFRPSPSVS